MPAGRGKRQADLPIRCLSTIRSSSTDGPGQPAGPGQPFGRAPVPGVRRPAKRVSKGRRQLGVEPCLRRPAYRRPDRGGQLLPGCCAAWGYPATVRGCPPHGSSVEGLQRAGGRWGAESRPRLAHEPPAPSGAATCGCLQGRGIPVAGSGDRTTPVALRLRSPKHLGTSGGYSLWPHLHAYVDACLRRPGCRPFRRRRRGPSRDPGRAAVPGERPPQGGRSPGTGRINRSSAWLGAVPRGWKAPGAGPSRRSAWCTGSTRRPPRPRRTSVQARFPSASPASHRP